MEPSHNFLHTRCHNECSSPPPPHTHTDRGQQLVVEGATGTGARDAPPPTFPPPPPALPALRCFPFLLEVVASAPTSAELFTDTDTYCTRPLPCDLPVPRLSTYTSYTRQMG
jgi:hypothetical protein